jgi:hypothetical protein
MKATKQYGIPLPKAGQQIEYQAQAMLERHVHFRGRASRFEFDCHAGVVVVRGSVPTFHLRNVLQEVLQAVQAFVGLIIR